MTKKIIDGVTITTDFDADLTELENYLEYVNLRVNEPFDTIHVTLCDDGCVDITWARNNQKFERIRRVTGYLVGTLDRWNDAKQAEERDRVKHEPRI